jgi:hypothetical protein
VRAYAKNCLKDYDIQKEIGAMFVWQLQTQNWSINCSASKRRSKQPLLMPGFGAKRMGLTAWKKQMIKTWSPSQCAVFER